MMNLFDRRKKRISPSPEGLAHAEQRGISPVLTPIENLYDTWLSRNKGKLVGVLGGLGLLLGTRVISDSTHETIFRQRLHESRIDAANAYYAVNVTRNGAQLARFMEEHGLTFSCPELPNSVTTFMNDDKNQQKIADGQYQLVPPRLTGEINELNDNLGAVPTITPDSFCGELVGQPAEVVSEYQERNIALFDCIYSNPTQLAGFDITTPSFDEYASAEAKLDFDRHPLGGILLLVGYAGAGFSMASGIFIDERRSSILDISLHIPAE